MFFQDLEDKDYVLFRVRQILTTTSYTTDDHRRDPYQYQKSWPMSSKIVQLVDDKLKSGTLTPLCNIDISAWRIREAAQVESGQLIDHQVVQAWADSLDADTSLLGPR